METLFTIGYTKKTLQEFIERLKNAGVDCIVDIRLNNTSQLAGFSKKDDLDFLLNQGFGISYIHLPELAPSEEILARYKADKNWAVYERDYGELADKRNMVKLFLDTAAQEGWRRPCLLCAEDIADHCHRRVLAEKIQAEVSGLEVKHL